MNTVLTSLKYLGIFFQRGYCLNCDIDNSVRIGFIRQQMQLLATVDMLLSYLNYFLMESYCLPLINYSCEALNYNRQQ